MPTGEKLRKKNAYMAKLVELVESTPLALIVCADNVGSKQMQNIRSTLRGKCTVLMGKNTMIRTALRKKIEARLAENENANISDLQNLVGAVSGNMGFIFCHETKNLDDARAALDQFVVPAMAKTGLIAPVDVVIPAGPTGLEPSQTSFFQALNIATKIVKGAIEITTDCKVVVKGQKVSLSAQALLTKMCLKPFEYGMKILGAFQDGCVFSAEVLDIDDGILITKFLNGVSHVAAFSREVGIPTEAGLPHMFTKAFKNIVASVVEVDFNAGEKVQEIKDILSDPEKLAAMKAAAASGGGGGAAAASGGGAKAEVKAAEEVVEEEEEMDFDLFG